MMNISIDNRDGQARIGLKGRFDFACRHDFKQACDDALSDEAVASVLIDLGGLEYLDSSALGMLLLLNDKSKTLGKTVALTTRPGLVADVLQVARFEKIFSLQQL